MDGFTLYFQVGLPECMELNRCNMDNDLSARPIPSGMHASHKIAGM